jgi:hypothetical protein
MQVSGSLLPVQVFVVDLDFGTQESELERGSQQGSPLCGYIFIFPTDPPVTACAGFKIRREGGDSAEQADDQTKEK